MPEISPAGWFVIRIYLEDPYVYRYDGAKWWLRSDGKEYWLTEDEQGVKIVENTSVPM